MYLIRVKFNFFKPENLSFLVNNFAYNFIVEKKTRSKGFCAYLRDRICRLLVSGVRKSTGGGGEISQDQGWVNVFAPDHLSLGWWNVRKMAKHRAEPPEKTFAPDGHIHRGAIMQEMWPKRGKYRAPSFRNWRTEWDLRPFEVEGLSEIFVWLTKVTDNSWRQSCEKDFKVDRVF